MQPELHSEAAHVSRLPLLLLSEATSQAPLVLRPSDERGYWSEGTASLERHTMPRVDAVRIAVSSNSSARGGNDAGSGFFARGSSLSSCRGSDPRTSVFPHKQYRDIAPVFALALRKCKLPPPPSKISYQLFYLIRRKEGGK